MTRGYDLDPVLDLGGPIFRDRAWFFVGYVPQVSRRERTVTFNSNNQLATFNNDSEDHNLNYNVTSQLSTNTRLRFAGGNIRGYGGVGNSLPAIEPNGTSTANPTLFPNPLHTNTTNDTYGGELAWVVSPKFFVNTDRRLLWLRTTFQVTDTQFFVRASAYHSGPRTPARARPDRAAVRSRKFPPRCSSSMATLTIRPARVTCATSSAAFGVNVDGTYYANFEGQHTLQGRRAVGASEQRRPHRCAGADRHAELERATERRWTIRHGRSAAPTATTPSRAATPRARSTRTTSGFFIQDAWTVSNRLTLNLGPALGRGNHPVLSSRESRASSSASARSSRRASASRTTSRATGSGRPTAAGACSTTSASSRCRAARGAPTTGSTTTTRSTPSTGRRSTARARQGSGCPGTFIEQADRRHVVERSERQPDRSEPQADSDAGVHARRRSRAHARRCRSACATRTSGWTGRSKTSGSRLPASARSS